jgi:hypothetical protein
MGVRGGADCRGGGEASGCARIHRKHRATYLLPLREKGHWCRSEKTCASLGHDRPTQGWTAFLRNHAQDIVAVDMLSVPTITFDRLYAFVVLGHGRRAILHVEVTDHPTAQWLAQQITEAFPWDTAPRYLVRDNDGAYGVAFRRRLRAMGVRDRPITPHSPWLNGGLYTCLAHTGLIESTLDY